MSGAPTRPTSYVSLSTKSSADARPGLRPTIGTRDGPQRYEWIDVSTCPVHTAALESHLDHNLVGTFGAAAADRVPGGLEGGVLHLRQTFGEVGHRAIPRFNCSRRISRQLDWQFCQTHEHMPHTTVTPSDRLRPPVHPPFRLPRPSPPPCLR